MERRRVVVPISKQAEFRLDYDECEDNDLVEYPLSEEKFYKLFNLGFFHQLNAELDLMIDDYEQEEILENKLDQLKVFMNSFMQQHPDNPILNDLHELFQVAYDKRTSVFFFF
ncbi:hypothetical protein [Psychrobacter sp. ENNN9_III]|uniref:hypothetical protein n=1 Tax=Psychrobacter sp. ENNN9_III TaxID=1254334 RepID=UPI00071E832D|nr:hypothetical protein [Psychrobacter sp. ENNN9_III]